MDNSEHYEDNEKRRFFRIDDFIHVTCQALDEATYNDKVALIEKGMTEQFLLMSDLSAISNEVGGLLNRIEANDPDLGMFLKALDRKIDLIGRAIMTEQIGLRETSAQAVNISASGLAMLVEHSMEAGSKVEIRMVLLPDNAGVIAYGNVVSCDNSISADGNGYLVRVDFTSMREEDRDMLIRHIMRKQGEMLRERRVARESHQTQG